MVLSDLLLLGQGADLASQRGVSCTGALPEASDPDLVQRARIARAALGDRAIVLGHHYQRDEVIEFADITGDSFKLAQAAAAQSSAEYVIFCGVHFMAETAKILSPNKTVLLPDLNAGCSLADACSPDEFAQFRADHPGHVVISYINCSAAIKAQSDLICTSSNAVAMVKSIPEEQGILFAPDQNLGNWVQKQTGRKLVLWPGSCIVHETFSEAAVFKLKAAHPKAELIAHPECQSHLLDLADFIGSTSKLLSHSKTSTASSFIVLTEPGILHQMRKAAPHKEFYGVPGLDGCSCNACPYMRLNTLDKLENCLKTMAPAINLEEGLRLRALAPIKKMLELSN